MRRQDIQLVPRRKIPRCPKIWNGLWESSGVGQESCVGLFCLRWKLVLLLGVGMNKSMPWTEAEDGNQSIGDSGDTSQGVSKRRLTQYDGG